MMRSTKVVVAATLVLPLCGAAQEKKIGQSSLPPAVQKTVQQQSGGATVTGFTTEVEHGSRVYEAEMRVNGHSKDIEIAEDGRLNEVEEEVAFGALPAAVQRSLTAKASGAKITKVESLTKHDKLVAYEAATLKGEKRGEIQVGPDGATLSHEE